MRTISTKTICIIKIFFFKIFNLDYDFHVVLTLYFFFQPATELIKDIAVLEVEVMHLEQYLLSLYRKAFDGQPNSVSPPKKSERLKSPVNTPRSRISEASKAGLVQSSGVGHGEEKLLDSGVHRCHSTLSQRSTRASPPGEASGKALRYCHSQPLSMSEVSLLVLIIQNISWP